LSKPFTSKQHIVLPNYKTKTIQKIEPSYHYSVIFQSLSFCVVYSTHMFLSFKFVVYPCWYFLSC